MENIVMASMVLAALNGVWWMVCDVTGPFLIRVLFKVVLGMGGLFVSGAWFANYFGI